MRIAVIGSGNIGGTIGVKWASAGHRVVFGSRDPRSPKIHTSSAASEAVQVASIADALTDAEVVLLALPSSAVADFVAEYGSALNNKLVIDATNKFGQAVINSLAVIQEAAPQATLVRAFNSLGWENFAEPVIDGVQVDLLYVGPDGEARAVIETLIIDIGLLPVRVGDLTQAALVDNIGALWGALAFGQKLGRRVAFKVLTPQ
ncbi:MAG: NAD(P)-binding domain-containing protein [Roseiflexaceae bacterium]|nr:NAD(P)-binding domain-containing protein [Roseiflexaceae bacterium]